jgi:hypothetical protein
VPPTPYFFVNVADKGLTWFLVAFWTDGLMGFHSLDLRLLPSLLADGCVVFRP